MTTAKRAKELADELSSDGEFSGKADPQCIEIATMLRAYGCILDASPDVAEIEKRAGKPWQIIQLGSMPKTMAEDFMAAQSDRIELLSLVRRQIAEALNKQDEFDALGALLERAETDASNRLTQTLKRSGELVAASAEIERLNMELARRDKLAECEGSNGPLPTH